MKIAVDIDGVLANLMPSLNGFYNKKFGTTFKVNDYQQHDLEKTWNCSKEEAIKIVQDFYASPEFLNVKPIPNSKVTISFLSKTHHLFSITSRPSSLTPLTDKFLKKNFANGIKKTIHTGQFTSHARNINKSDICHSEHADLLVEDCFETAMDAADSGLKVFLFNQPWNASYSQHHENLTRVNGWQEIRRRLT